MDGNALARVHLEDLLQQIPELCNQRAKNEKNEKKHEEGQPTQESLSLSLSLSL
jgi:hypothetical protein